MWALKWGHYFYLRPLSYLIIVSLYLILYLNLDSFKEDPQIVLFLNFPTNKC